MARSNLHVVRVLTEPRDDVNGGRVADERLRDHVEIGQRGHDPESRLGSPARRQRGRREQHRQRRAEQTCPHLTLHSPSSSTAGARARTIGRRARDRSAGGTRAR